MKTSGKKKDRKAFEEIFSEEEFLRVKKQKRREQEKSIEMFYNT
jgi:hypothetical protein